MNAAKISKLPHSASEHLSPAVSNELINVAEKDLHFPCLQELGATKNNISQATTIAENASESGCTDFTNGPGDLNDNVSKNAPVEVEYASVTDKHCENTENE